MVLVPKLSRRVSAITVTVPASGSMAISGSTWVRGSECASGISSSVRFAAWIAAMRARGQPAAGPPQTGEQRYTASRASCPSTALPGAGGLAGLRYRDGLQEGCAAVDVAAERAVLRRLEAVRLGTGLRSGDGAEQGQRQDPDTDRYHPEPAQDRRAERHGHDLGDGHPIEAVQKIDGIHEADHADHQKRAFHAERQEIRQQAEVLRQEQHDTQGNEPSGFIQQFRGQSVLLSDAEVKIRRAHVVPGGSPLEAEIRHIFQRRVIRETRHSRPAGANLFWRTLTSRGVHGQLQNQYQARCRCGP